MTTDHTAGLVRPRKTPEEAALDGLLIERKATLEAPPQTISDWLDSAKFELAQTIYFVQQINALRVAAQLPPLTRAQVRQGIIDIYNSLP